LTGAGWLFHKAAATVSLLAARPTKVLMKITQVSGFLLTKDGLHLIQTALTSVVPQKPSLEQQTFKGHVAESGKAYCPHSAFASQLEMQVSLPHSLGENPQIPS
jgi:hypothetical protein